MTKNVRTALQTSGPLMEIYVDGNLEEITELNRSQNYTLVNPNIS